MRDIHTLLGYVTLGCSIVFTFSTGALYAMKGGTSDLVLFMLGCAWMAYSIYVVGKGR